MNIFYISNDPTECAQALDSLRLNKMLIESIQMLSTAAVSIIDSLRYDCIEARFVRSIHRLDMGFVDFDHFDMLAKPTHKNHPCTVWCGSSKANYAWLVSLADAMHAEWLYRGHKPHRCYVNRMSAVRTVLQIYSNYLPRDFTAPPNCSMFKGDELILAYKKTLIEKWKSDKGPPTWENRGEPLWKSILKT